MVKMMQSLEMVKDENGTYVWTGLFTDVIPSFERIYYGVGDAIVYIFMRNRRWFYMVLFNIPIYSRSIILVVLGSLAEWFSFALLRRRAGFDSQATHQIVLLSGRFRAYGGTR